MDVETLAKVSARVMLTLRGPGGVFEEYFRIRAIPVKIMDLGTATAELSLVDIRCFNGTPVVTVNLDMQKDVFENGEGI